MKILQTYNSFVLFPCVLFPIPPIYSTEYIFLRQRGISKLFFVLHSAVLFCFSAFIAELIITGA